jgi:hypothetical protein
MVEHLPSMHKALDSILRMMKKKRISMHNSKHIININSFNPPNITKQHYEAHTTTVIIPISQLKKLRHREYLIPLPQIPQRVSELRLKPIQSAPLVCGLNHH